MSCAVLKPSRDVLTKSFSRSSRGANATECSNASSRPSPLSTDANTESTFELQPFAIRDRRSRPLPSAKPPTAQLHVPSHFLVHPSRDHLEDHHVVGGEGVERVAERGGLVVLDEEVAVPGETVSDDGRSEEEPRADSDAEDDADEDERRADEVQDARARKRMRAHVIRPEIGEGTDVHRVRLDFRTNSHFTMTQDFQELLKEIFGEPISRLTQFQSDKLAKLTSRVQDLAREAVKDELAKLHQEIGELRSRVARLEQERAEKAAESLEASF